MVRGKTNEVGALKGLRDTLFYELDRLREDKITPKEAKEVSIKSEKTIKSIRKKLRTSKNV